MKVGARHVGRGHPPYVIAEIGVNHDGDADKAVELVRRAAEAGADAVKFQCFRAELLMSRASRLANYQKAAGERDPIEMLRRLELSIEDLARCAAAAQDFGLHAIVTVFSLELVAEAGRIGWDAYKTASPDIVHRPLLEALAATGKPLIVSTGASTMEEVGRAVEWLRPAHDRLALLQCVSSYPTPMEHAELGGITALARAFAQLPIGYSDHTAETETAAAAVGLGACILEKHFTLDHLSVGPDHAASLEPEQFRPYQANARTAFAYPRPPIVEPIKRVLPIEQDVRTVSRQSIVAARDLPVGHTITRADVTFKRPGTGLAPYELDRVVGTRVRVAIGADTPLTFDSTSANDASGR